MPCRVCACSLAAESVRRSLFEQFRLHGGRKVRAPQGRVPGNAWGARAYGKCNRKDTAFASEGKGEKVR